MPGPLTAKGLNFGRNLALELLIGGQTITIANLITESGARPLSTLHTELPINNDGVPVRDLTHEGIEISLKITRQNGQFDQIYAALMNNYYNGGVTPQATLTRTISNPDGSANQQIFSNGIVEFRQLGTFKHNDTVNDVDINVTFSLMEATDGGGNGGINLGPVGLL